MVGTVFGIEIESDSALCVDINFVFEPFANVRDSFELDELQLVLVERE